MTVGVLTG